MGLSLPAAGLVYLDTPAIIYTVEKRPYYLEQLMPLWLAARSGSITAGTSALALLETLVMPIRNKDEALQADYDHVLLHADIRLLPITNAVLREAASLRATIPALRTPDALHAATALLSGCVLFVSNDNGFRRIPGLPLALLDNAA